MTHRPRPVLVTWVARPLRQSQSWLRESIRRRRGRQRTGRRSGCQVRVSPPPPPQSAVPGWARPSWSGAGPPPVPCEVRRRRRRLRCSRPPEPPPLPGGPRPWRARSPTCSRPLPGGLECASREGAGPALPLPLPQPGDGSGLAEPGLEVREADGLTEGRAAGVGVGGGGERGPPVGSVGSSGRDLRNAPSPLICAFHPHINK